MAISYTHVQLSNVDRSGNVKVIYPQNTAKVVSVDRSANASVIPSTVKTAQDLTDNLEAPAFTAANKFVYISPAGTAPENPMNTEINDNTTGSATTWSSKKINDKINTVSDRYSTDRPNLVFFDTTNSVEEGNVEPEIDDSIMTLDKTWSSYKINTEINKTSHIDHNSYIDLGSNSDSTSAGVINNPVRYPRIIAITVKKEVNENTGFPLPVVNFSGNSDIYWYVEYVPTAIDPETKEVISAYENYVGFTNPSGSDIQYFRKVRVYLKGSTETGWNPITGNYR